MNEIQFPLPKEEYYNSARLINAGRHQGKQAFHRNPLERHVANVNRKRSKHVGCGRGLGEEITSFTLAMLLNI